MSSPVSQKRKADLKVVIMGSASIGKTTLIHRYIEGRFQETISTIGASFYLKQWGHYNIALWDTAGEERFSGLSSFYCRGAGAAILAFDLTEEDTFHALRTRFVPLLHGAEDRCLVVVVGTKLDLLESRQRQVNPEDGFMLAKELNRNNHSVDLPYFETSSLNGKNVNRVFEYIFSTLLPLDEPPSNLRKKNPSVVDLESKPAAGQGKGCACVL